MEPTTTDYAVIALMMRLFPNLRLKRKILTESERSAARMQVHFLSSLYSKLVMR
jgi:hypothetical protein